VEIWEFPLQHASPSPNDWKVFAQHAALAGAALFLAALLALVATLVAVLIHKLEEKAGLAWLHPQRAGRLVVFGKAAMPAFGLAVFLILIFAIQLKWLPVAGMFSLGKPGTWATASVTSSCPRWHWRFSPPH